MTTRVRVWIAAATLVAVAGLIYVAGASFAQESKDLIAPVIKIGAMIKSGDDAGATKMAAASAKKYAEHDVLMHLFRPRNKGGLGVGTTPGSNPAKDGIEVTLRDFARDVPASVAKQADALETTGYWIAAMADVNAAKGWEKDQGKKTKKAWGEFSKDMRTAGIAFSKAAAAKGGQQIKTAAAKVNAACNNCHSIFKD